jgi:hypothetical protein
MAYISPSHTKGDFTHPKLVVIGRGPTPVKILFRLRLKKTCPRRSPTTTCKGTDHALMSKMNVYTKFNKKNIYFKKLNIYFKKIIKKNTG